MANTFQGYFPDKNTSEDGYAGVAPYPRSRRMILVFMTWPATSGSGSRIGIVQITTRNSGGTVRLPSIRQGPKNSFDPQELRVAKRVQKGGSFLCTAQYCERYMPGAGGKGDPETGTNHLVFRCLRGR